MSLPLGHLPTILAPIILGSISKLAIFAASTSVLPFKGLRTKAFHLATSCASLRKHMKVPSRIHALFSSVWCVPRPMRMTSCPMMLALSKRSTAGLPMPLTTGWETPSRKPKLRCCVELGDHGTRFGILTAHELSYLQDGPCRLQ